ncbi:MAG: SPFH domain-containing protein [Bacteroidetes bacterium]|nr:MAG: SPFH domain-containing protein [Bacteroidota bacterium]
MENQHEKIIRAKSGYTALVLAFLFILAVIIGNAVFYEPLSSLFIIGFIFIAPGFFYLNPNESVVLTLFGEYIGTVKKNGFYWANPFYSKRKISLRARNFDSERLKVNDKIGNPIMISIILVWRVKDTYKAAFEVDDYESFVRVQSDAAVRKLAGMFPYDNFDDESDDLTLRAGGEKVNNTLEQELEDRLKIAGIEVLEARIAYLAYAEEIANAMLKRQQATAIIAARKKIVEGAVGMVEDALNKLAEKELVHLDEQKKAMMVSNLMVVLCSDKETVPVVNTGNA